MANTLGITNADVIAQRALEALITELPFLAFIANDFSDQRAKFGERIIVKEVEAAAAVDFDQTTGYVPAARGMIDIPVTINKHKHHTYQVTVVEASTSRVDLINRFAMTAAHSLGAAICADLGALVKAAAFANYSTKALGAGGDGFNRKALVQAGVKLGKRGVPTFGRFCLLNADYYGSLKVDDNLATAFFMAQQAAIQTGILPNIEGFKLGQFVDLPDNGENLVGFAGVPSCLALATRIPDDPGVDFNNVRLSIVTEPQTGISIQVREWYNADAGAYRRTYTLMYGVAAGQANALERIVSA